MSLRTEIKTPRSPCKCINIAWNFFKASKKPGKPRFKGFPGKKYHAAGRDRTDTVCKHRGILSPLRLPVPPQRHAGHAGLRHYKPVPSPLQYATGYGRHGRQPSLCCHDLSVSAIRRRALSGARSTEMHPYTTLTGLPPAANPSLSVDMMQLSSVSTSRFMPACQIEVSR